MPRQFPEFKFTAEDVKPAIEKFIEQAKEAVKAAKSVESPTWNDYFQLETSFDEMGLFQSELGHLLNVQTTPELEEAYESTIPMTSEFFSGLGQDKELYEFYLKVSKTDLTAEQSRILDFELKSFKRSGFELEPEQQKRLNEINESLSVLSNNFRKNNTKTVAEWSKTVTLEELKGVPESDVARMKNEDGQYVLTLQAPDYIAIISYCENRELRKEMYFAYNQIGSEFMLDGKYDNKEIIKEIQELRKEKAELLGYENYAEYSIEPKMASSAKEVVDFLDDITSKVSDKASVERNEIFEFGKEKGYITDKLELWDASFIVDKMKIEKFNIDESKLKEYFPESKVKSGLFWFVEHMFGYKLKEMEAPFKYHDDVSLVEISKDGQVISYIYMDLYARKFKRSGAWMDDYQHRNGDIKPLAYVVCNFSKGVDGEEALFTYSDVTTLFHEFGHALHHTLTRVETLGLQGISHVPWDAVELPSTFMEFFCSNETVLNMCSEHVKTKQPIPAEMVQKIKDMDNFMSATFLLRQMELSLSDMYVHINAEKEINTVAREFKAKHGMPEIPSNVAPYNSFGHIYAGGYAAGYYSYKWADILSSDIFETFEENGVLCQDTAKRYLDEILSQGGSKEMSELFKNFKGRDPKPDAFLKYSGIK